jgi:regulator of protease activity HflC (stomatin/prohibitin superfamily)
VSEAISKGDVQALNYFVALKYTEAMGKIGTATNSKVVLMPMEASALIGTLGGISEIAKEVFRTEGTAGAARQAARPPVVRPSEN